MKKENPNNIEYICSHHSKERLEKWQKENKDTIIKIGDFIKTSFKDPETNAVEHMWIRVTEVKDENYIGKLHNEPVLVEHVTFGQKVLVKRENIQEHMAT